VRVAATSMAALLFLVGMVGCEAEPQTGPTTAALSQERKARAANLAAGKVRPAKKREAIVEQGEADAPSFAAVDLRFSFNFDTKRDPFRSFKWEQLEMAREMAEMSGPLEQYDLSQLSLVAVVWKIGASKALVQDPSGQSYIVAAGAKIGKNNGYVVAIDDNLVMVKETYLDYLGQETTKDIEMRIRRSQGG
jgi:Tfp pilus assembly protein PilP